VRREDRASHGGSHHGRSRKSLEIHLPSAVDSYWPEWPEFRALSMLARFKHIPQRRDSAQHGTPTVFARHRGPGARAANGRARRAERSGMVELHAFDQAVFAAAAK
jgi:hypothetical protein